MQHEHHEQQHKNAQMQESNKMTHEQHGAMGQRGVTRPQMDMEHEHGDMKISHEDRIHMRQKHHKQTLWVPATIVVLGVWLMGSPFTFGYESAKMMGSDLISGLLLVVLGSIWFRTPRWPVVPWAACFVGIWLQFAPLVFWAPTAVAYVTDTLIGAWVIALTVLIPGMPGMIMIMKHGPDIPPGWSYNPSSWPQRAPIIALGFAGWFISRYLAAFQLGYISNVWDPFFGDGSVQVLTSKVSRAWPISDAGLGAFSYTFESLMGFMGGISRWRTMPWMVTFFGILVIPLGLTHIILVILQPVIVGEWCFLCLAAAAVMLPMIPLSVDEVVTMCQFIVRRYREGQPFWRIFWKGGTVEGGNKDMRTPNFDSPLSQIASAMVWGMTAPWALVISTALGLWLIFAPTIFQSQGAAADSDHLVGALVITVAVIAMAEVVRAVRFFNVLAGLWLIAAPWLLSGSTPGTTWNDVIAGALLLILSLPRGPIKEKYGNWDRYIV